MPIYVYGDVTIDNYEYRGRFSDPFSKRVRESQDPAIPRLSGRFDHRIVTRNFGGAYLLARHIAVALALWRTKNSPKPLNQIDPWAEYWLFLDEMTFRLAKNPAVGADVLNLFCRLTKAPDKCYRVERGGFEGYTLPARHKTGEPYLRTLQRTLSKKGGRKTDESSGIILDERLASKTHLMLINDGGIRGASDGDNWIEDEIKSIDQNELSRTWAVIKSHDPVIRTEKQTPDEFDRENQYLDQLNRLLPDRTVICLSADDMRASGVPISRSLSWEKTLVDLVHHIDSGNILPGYLAKHLIVTFDFDAAVYLKLRFDEGRAKVDRGSLVFSTDRTEGEYAAQYVGSMPGSQSLFVSIFAGLLYEWFENGNASNPFEIEMRPNQSSQLEPAPVERFLTYALIAKQRMLACGFQPLDSDDVLVTREDGSGDGTTWVIPQVLYQEAAFALRETSDQQEEQLAALPPSPFMASESSRHAFHHPLERGQHFKKDISKAGLLQFRFDDGFFLQDNKEIFNSLCGRLTREDFVDYVLAGKCKHPLPICSIGKLKSVSTEEIESLRTIRRLVRTYLEDEGAGETPLGLAVFGPPGSGKSFAVKSVFETLPGSSKELFKESFLECNLSGLSKDEDIAHFFQLARDRRLRGRVPILFFDEFDCTVGGMKYYWLKHFLAPLQDGEFTSGHVTHPIGKSIFIFAGGVNPSFEKFQRSLASDLHRDKAEEAKEDAIEDDGDREDRAPPDVKGKDFLSRLQGHIDIKGLEPDGGGAAQQFNDPSEIIGRKNDRFETNEFKPFAMRRAIVLRGLLEKRAPSIFSIENDAKMGKIDRELVYEFLSAWQYKHGARSIEAIIRMSSLDSKGNFSPYCLPPKAQLSMHVDPEGFEMLYQ